MIVGIDFDGTLVEAGRPLRWRRGARGALLSMAARGYRLILHSARLSPARGLTPEARQEAAQFWRTGLVPPEVEAQWRDAEEMRAFLRREGCLGAFAEAWERPGKPACDVFYDDRAEAPDWLAVARELG